MDLLKLVANVVMIFSMGHFSTFMFVLKKGKNFLVHHQLRKKK